MQMSRLSACHPCAVAMQLCTKGWVFTAKFHAPPQHGVVSNRHAAHNFSPPMHVNTLPKRRWPFESFKVRPQKIHRTESCTWSLHFCKSPELYFAM